MAHRLLLILALSQTGCGIGFSALFASRTTTVETLRPDSAEARLYCDGAPCQSFQATTRVEKPSPWAYAAGMVLEGTCAALAHGEEGGLQAAGVACGFSFVWDLLTIPLLPLGGGFSPRTFASFDHQKVELEFQGRRTSLFPGFQSSAMAGLGVFSAEKAFGSSLSMEDRLARMRLCAGLRKRVRLRYVLSPLDGPDWQRLEGEIRQRLEADLGPPDERPGRTPELRIEPSLYRAEGQVVLRMRLLAEPYDREIGHGAINAGSIEEMHGRLVFEELYGHPCDAP